MSDEWLAKRAQLVIDERERLAESAREVIAKLREDSFDHVAIRTGMNDVLAHLQNILSIAGNARQRTATLRLVPIIHIAVQGGMKEVLELFCMELAAIPVDLGHRHFKVELDLGGLGARLKGKIQR
jgi:hypothetical protein